MGDRSGIGTVILTAAALWVYGAYIDRPAPVSGMVSEYGKELAGIAKTTAGKLRAGEFQNHKQLSDFTHEMGRAAHQRTVNDPLGQRLEAVNKRLEGKFDAAAYAEEWERIAHELGG